MNATTASRPEANEHDPYYQSYFDLVTEEDIFGPLESQPDHLREVLAGLSDEEANTLHAPYTWTIKQAIGHCIDNERVFGYRALRFASGDATDLPGYDQDVYVRQHDYDAMQLEHLIDEFAALRRSNVAMIKRIPESSWNNTGTNDGRNITVRAIIWLFVAHLRHHLNIVKKRLGKN